MQLLSQNSINVEVSFLADFERNFERKSVELKKIANPKRVFGITYTQSMYSKN